MRPDIATTWTDDLTPEQLDQLQWLRERKCIVEAQFAPPDPLHGMPAGVVLEVMVDKHAVVKIRGENVSEMFDMAFRGAQNLFNYVNEPEERL